MFCGGCGDFVWWNVMYVCVFPVAVSMATFTVYIVYMTACVVFCVVGMVALLHWHTTVCSATAFKVLPVLCY